MIRLHGPIKGFSSTESDKSGLQGDVGFFIGVISQPQGKKGSSRNPGKDRNKNADLVDDVRASKHI
ncbi:hypothetical protein VRB14_24360 [Pseudomonas trivialis]